ncbi:MAG: DNA-binding protein [Actinobacteria bacterium]|nr:DNA-binding protein [Actinomycetota bacterium]
MGSIKIFFITIFSGLLIASGLSASNVEVTSSELINNAKEYDKKEVIYSGEVIGDIMKRDEHAWINISDGSNAIGVWIPFEETEKIGFTGQYKYKGDIVKITGIFNRACSEHGGDLDIHAKSIEIIERGYEIKRNINFYGLIAGIVLFIIAMSLSLVIYSKKL